MAAPIHNRMTVEAFIAWCDAQPDERRYELVHGEIVAMSPKRTGHAKKKLAAVNALIRGIELAELACWALPDGITVPIDEHTAYEPDALAYCGKEVPDDTVTVSHPIIVVEVLSPSTRQVDLSLKLADYFRLDSVQHYLIVNADRASVIHHARADNGSINTRITSSGSIMLDPPGIEIDVAAIYA